MDWCVSRANVRLPPGTAAQGKRERAPFGGREVKFLGFLLLLAGWAIVLSAVVLLSRDVPRNIFVLAGIGVEMTGCVLVFGAHPLPRGEDN